MIQSQNQSSNLAAAKWLEPQDLLEFAEKAAMVDGKTVWKSCNRNQDT